MKYFFFWLFITLAGGYIGSEWAIKDVPKGQELWAGDGIGILLYGALGSFYGAVIATAAILGHLLVKSLLARGTKQPSAT